MKRLLLFCTLLLFWGSVLPCVADTSLVDLYRKALSADPQNQTLAYHLGVALLNRGENRKALKLFRRVYAQRATDPEINFNLALVYSRLNDPDSALLYLDQAQASGAGKQPEIYPLQNVYLNLVLLYEQLNQIDDAIILLQRLLKENPAHLEYQRVLGDYLLRSGRMDEAVPVLKNYLEKMPEDNEVREYAFAAIFNRGLAAYEKGQLAVARDEFSKALQFVARSPLVFYYLALLDYQNEKYSQAANRLIPVFHALGENLKSGARSLLYNTALTLQQQGDFAMAQQALSPLTSGVHPRTKDLMLLANIQLKAQKYSLARQSYLRILRDNPENLLAINGVQAAEKGAFEEFMEAAGSAFKAGKLSLVRRNLAQAADIYPDNNRLLIYQARLSRLAKQNWLKFQRQAERLEEQQQYPQALVAVRQALEFAPQESGLLRLERRLVKHLGARITNLYQQGKELYAAKKFNAARAVFQQLVQLSPAHRGGKDYLKRIEHQQQQSAQQLVADGEQALEQADLLKARRSFKRALQVQPEIQGAAEGLKRTEQMLASRVAETLVQARRLTSEGFLVSARDLLASGQKKWPAKTLATELAQVKKKLEQRQRSLVKLVRSAVKKEQFAQAAQLLTQVRQLGVDPALIAEVNTELKKARSRARTEQLELARQQVENGNYDAGLKAYRRVLDIEPGNKEALQGLKQGREALEGTISRLLVEGAAARKAAQVDQAREAYRKVLNLDPHRAEALAALHQIGRSGQAGLTSADSQHLYLQGIELYTEGDYKQAIAIWYQVLDLDPDHRKARRNIEKARRKLKQIQERQSG